MNRSDFKANWHTHNFRCRHALGDFADYAFAAREAGISVLGISDHCPTPDDRDCGVRMRHAELQGYIDGFRAARDAVPGVTLHLGVELEHYRDILPGYAESLLAAGIEYIAGATHFFHLPDGRAVSSWTAPPAEDQPRYALAYGDFVVEMIESGLYAFIAHPDLIGCFCDRWLPECEEAARKIARAARDCGIPLELNTSGYAKHPKTDTGTGAPRPQYPWEPFWRAVREEGAAVLVNSDAHRPDLLLRHLDDALGLCARCGIEPLVFTRVSGNRLFTESRPHGACPHHMNNRKQEKPA